MKLRVLFITSSYPASEDDPRGTFIHVLARALAEAGVEVTVLAPGARGAPRQETRDGVGIHRATYWIPRWQSLASGLSGIVPNLRSRPWLLLQVIPLVMALTFKALRLGKDKDIVHAHWVFPSGIAGAVAARKCRVPLILTSHGGDLNLAARSSLLRWLVRRVVPRAKRCVGVTEALAAAFVRYGAPGDCALHIPYGVDTRGDASSTEASDDDALRRLRSAAPPRFLYVGSLIPRKSVHTMLEAAAIASRSASRGTYAILGAGPERANLEAIARRNPSLDVIFAGERSPAVVSNWLQACDALILPSLSEGRPLVVLEAMARSRAVIASDLPGTRELVCEGRSGLLFPPGDEHALASHLVSLGSDPTRAKSMGMRGAEIVAERGLTATAIARRYDELYRIVAASLVDPSRAI